MIQTIAVTTGILLALIALWVLTAWNTGKRKVPIQLLFCLGWLAVLGGCITIGISWPKPAPPHIIFFTIGVVALGVLHALVCVATVNDFVTDDD